MKANSTNISISKSIFRVALGMALILMVPLLGGWPWTLSDFIIMGILLFVTGFALELVMKRTGDRKKKIIAGLAVLAVFFYLWAELAVGIFTNWGS